MCLSVCVCVHAHVVFKVVSNKNTPYSSDAWEVKTGLTEQANVATRSFPSCATADYRTLGNRVGQEEEKRGYLVSSVKIVFPKFFMFSLTVSALFLVPCPTKHVVQITLSLTLFVTALLAFQPCL